MDDPRSIETPPPPPRPGRTPADPGTRTSRLFALIAAVLATLGVVLLQNVPPTLDLLSDAAPAEQPQAGAIAPPGPAEMAGVLGRLYVRLADALGRDPTAMAQYDAYAFTPAEKVRAAIVAGEVEGPASALQRLRDLLASETLPPSSLIRADAEDLALVYESGPASIDPMAADRLRANHGYFARVALTHDDPTGSETARRVRVGGVTILLLIFGVGLVMLLAVLAGLALFIVAVVQIAGGRLPVRMPAPEPGGSVYLEVFALFVAGFLVLQGVGGLLHALASEGETWPATASLAMQWLLLLAPLWPLVRGVSPAALRDALGLRAQRGLLREIAAGVVGYLAGLPLFLGGVILSLVLMMLAQTLRRVAGMGDPPAPTNAVLELIGSAGPLQVALIVALATVWAPLCEELVFRGALLRHLRGRWTLAAAVLVTATVFGFMHGYGPLLVFPLIALGGVFCGLRAWRGSVIAPITAHALHNGTVMIVLITVLTLLGD